MGSCWPRWWRRGVSIALLATALQPAAPVAVVECTIDGDPNRRVYRLVDHGNTVVVSSPINPGERALTPTYALNVRAGAGTDQPLLGMINPGDQFAIRGESAGWYQIDYNGTVGWVSADYVTVSNP